MQLLETKAEFSRRMGWARSTVTRFAAAGKLVTVGDKVDVHASLYLLECRASKEPHHVAHKKALARARVNGVFVSPEYRERQKKLAARRKQTKEERCAGYDSNGRPLLRLKKWVEQHKERVLDAARTRTKKRWDENRAGILCDLKKCRAALDDPYIAKRLDIPLKKCSSEMIEAKRSQMLIARSIKQLEKTIEERKDK